MISLVTAYVKRTQATLCSRCACAISDIHKGKSSGYRVIYQVRQSEAVVLVTVYSKLDQGDVSTEQIRRFLAEFEDC